MEENSRPKEPRKWSNPEILKSIRNPSGKKYVIKIMNPEVTFLGVPQQPDFAEVSIRFTPGDSVIELKSLKQYFFDFRNRILSYERFLDVVFEDLMAVYRPRHLRVKVKCNPRGGIESVLVADSAKRE